MRRGLVVLVFFALFPYQSAAAADAVGTVKEILVYAYGTPPQEKRGAVYARDDIYMQELLETVKKGAMRVVFKDKSVFTLGSNARMTVDELVYDPATKSGKQVLNLLVGTFRYVSGDMPKNAITIKSPVMTLGIRGTDLIIEVDPDGTTRVIVVEGEATPVATIGNEGAVELADREEVTIDLELGMGKTKDWDGSSRDVVIRDLHKRRKLAPPSSGSDNSGHSN